MPGKVKLITASVIFATASFAAAPRIITGPDSGSGQAEVKVFLPDGRSANTVPMDITEFRGGVRVAVGDVVGLSDLIVGAGPGAGPHVKVFTGGGISQLAASFLAFDASFKGGVNVAAGDVNGDGRADIIVGAGSSSGHVKVFDGSQLNNDGGPINDTALLASFFAFGPSFTGGVSVAAGDVNGDGRADIIVGTATGNSHVKVFSGATQAEVQSFFAFQGFSGGVFVGASDVNGDGFDDIIVGAASGTNGHVKVFDGTSNAELASFFAFPPANPSAPTDGGVRVSGADLNRDGFGDILVASGPGSTTTVKVFNGVNLEVMATVAPYGTSTTGAFVAARTKFPPLPLNISTRLSVLTDDNVLIGGFIVRGTELKRILIRGIGPSLPFGSALQDPTLELNEGSALLASNDDWRSDQQREIESSTIPPSNDLEAAIVRTLEPGAYTAVLRGKNNGTGVGLVEVYDLGQTADGKLSNISSRGFVGTGDNVLIGGFIVGGGTGKGNARIVARGIGPSLEGQGVSGALLDPTIELFNASGVAVRANDNWQSDQQEELNAVALQPTNDRESAVVEILAPGNYTAVVRGKDDSTGVALVEIYNVQ